MTLAVKSHNLRWFLPLDALRNSRAFPVILDFPEDVKPLYIVSIMAHNILRDTTLFDGSISMFDGQMTQSYHV